MSFICALLSREGVFIMPILLLLYHYAFKKRINRSLFLSLLGVSFIYIVFRAFILKTLLVKSLLPYTPSTDAFFKRIPGFFVALTYYLRILVLPIDLHVDYGDKLFHLSDPKTILGVVMTVLLIIYALKTKKKSKLLFFSVFWFYISFLPNTNIYKINDSFMKEHWLYIPSIGFFLILANILISLYRTKSLKTIAVTFTLAIVLWYSYLTIRQNVYWSNPFVFMRRSLQYSNNYIFYSELGREYENIGKHKEAVAAYKKAIEINPRKSGLYCDLGGSYKADGCFEDAIVAYKKALEIDPKEISAYYEMGDLYDKTGNKQEALKAYLQALEIDPAYPEAANNLAAIYADAGEVDKAIELWNKVITINPRFAIAHFNLAVFYFQKKQYGLAIKHCGEAIRFGHKVDPQFLGLLQPYRK
jgi:tetratricopeptide (TPR) repeat protein